MCTLLEPQVNLGFFDLAARVRFSRRSRAERQSALLGDVETAQKEGQSAQLAS